MLKYYTGIGTREEGLPSRIAELMSYLGHRLAKLGYTLRSGHASGSDEAFERGCSLSEGDSEIFLPWPSFRKEFRNSNINYLNLDYSSKVVAGNYFVTSGIIKHFYEMSKTSQNFHSRNYYQVTGKTGVYSDFVLYYAPMDLNNEPMGGTRSAVLRAIDLGIPTYNLGNELELESFLVTWLGGNL